MRMRRGVFDECAMDNLVVQLIYAHSVDYLLAYWVDWTFFTYIDRNTPGYRGTRSILLTSCWNRLMVKFYE